jgi:hypothetical protein
VRSEGKRDEDWSAGCGDMLSLAGKTRAFRSRASCRERFPGVATINCMRAGGATTLDANDDDDELC